MPTSFASERRTVALSNPFPFSWSTSSMPFLKIVAEDLYNVTGGNFENVTIIFPNKRASLFFNQYLAELNGKRPMWLPKYVTISEMFSNLSSLTIADHILMDEGYITVVPHRVDTTCRETLARIQEDWNL